MSDTPDNTGDEHDSNTTPDAPFTPEATSEHVSENDSPSEAIHGATTYHGELASEPVVAASAPIVDEAPLASQSRQSKGLWSTRLSLLLVAALVGGLAGHFAAPSSSNDGGLTIKVSGTAPGAAILPNGVSIPKLVQRVLPSIVSIDVKGSGEEDQGTGMIISKRGLVVTNNHVIAAAVNGGTITVTRSGSTKSEPATLIGTNPVDDVALIRINNASNLPTVTFGNSNALETGDAVVAIGNALGLAAGTPTVTQGIVSALGRTVTAGTSSSSETLENMIQTDAAINPGNSGGALVDAAGNLLGINTAIYSRSGGSLGIGFAIPSNTVKSVVSQLEKTGHVVRGYIGVEAQGVNAAMADALHLPGSTTEDRGALVASVEADGPAAHAGVQPGDVITKVNGEATGNPRELAIDVSQLPPGTHASLDIVRQGHPQTVDVTIGTLPAEGAGASALSPHGTQSLGVALGGLTPNVRQQLDLQDSTRGAVITQVTPGSAADQAGLQGGDVITGVGDKAVTGGNDASRLIRESLKANQAVALRIIRNGEPIFVAVAPAQGGDQGGDSQDDGNG